jgi:uncharacterized protein YlxP (DUF503 family)
MNISPVVGILRVTLHVPASGSLKAKRQVTASLLRRVRQRYQVAAAEVGDGDRWQLADLAVAYVSSDRRHADEVLQRVLQYIEAEAEAVVSDVSTELVTL